MIKEEEEDCGVENMRRIRRRKRRPIYDKTGRIRRGRCRKYKKNEYKMIL